MTGKQCFCPNTRRDLQNSSDHKQ